MNGSNYSVSNDDSKSSESEWRMWTDHNFIEFIQSKTPSSTGIFFFSKILI